MRRAFSLMVTLSVLTVLIALTSVLLGYFGQAKHDAELSKALIQANVFFADIRSQLTKLGSKRARLLYRYPLALSDESGRFRLSMRCEPINGGININWLGYDNDPKRQGLYQEAQSLFDVLAQKYAIEDPQRLLEMIRNQIVGTQTFLQKPQSRLRQKKGIISYRQFADIIARYEFETDDTKVAKIAWRHYFGFSSDAQKIEIEYAKPELISYLFDIDLPTVKEWFALSPQERGSLKTFVENNGVNYDEKAHLFVSGNEVIEAHCEVRFKGGKGEYGFGFDYIGNEAKYFEFHGQ